MVSFEKFKAGIIQSILGVNYWSESGLRALVDCQIILDENNDKNQLYEQAHQAYKEKFPHNKRRITKQEIKEKIEIPKREKAINWDDDKLKPNFVAHRQNM